VSNRLVVGPAAPCRPATAGEVVPALRLVLAADGRVADEAQAVDFIRFTARRGISLTDVWVVPDTTGRRLLWAALPMVSPGRTMLLFAAPSAVSVPAALSAGVEVICRHHAARDVQLAQVLLNPADQTTAELYHRQGFAFVADLLYLQRAVRRSSPIPAPPPGVRLVNYSADTHAAFAITIAASYEDSLDCPPLNGIRNMADVIAGHQAAGEFDPADWFLATDDRGTPLGVLLLARTTAGDGMELVYLGLTPAARGRGLGAFLVRLAEARAAAAKLRHLTLAVDSANAPAINLYHRHGLQQIAVKRALMRLLTPETPAGV
jgi:mycothiol synthase